MMLTTMMNPDHPNWWKSAVIYLHRRLQAGALKTAMTYRFRYLC